MFDLVSGLVQNVKQIKGLDRKCIWVKKKYRFVPRRGEHVTNQKFYFSFLFEDVSKQLATYIRKTSTLFASFDYQAISRVFFDIHTSLRVPLAISANLRVL